MASAPAVLFDVDGTLVDTNWFHTLSWWRGLGEAGEAVPMSRIHPLIGMGSDQLLQALFGEKRDDLKPLHSKHFEPFKAEIRAFDKAAGLLAEVARRGGLVVLATSAKESDLEQMLEAIDAGEVITKVIHADQVGAAKPEPDIFQAAIDALDLNPRTTIVVGDTRWDVDAASAAGVPTVAVLTGGNSRDDLLAAGAVAVYEDVADLLAHLDDSPLGRLLAPS